MRTHARFSAMGGEVGGWHEKLSGALLLVAGAAILMGIVTAEALYPASYSTHRNTVSDLAAMRPHNLIRQPSAAIFNWTMIVTGVLIIVAAYFLHRALRRRSVAVPTALLGIGVLGVGIFPGNHLTEHQLFAMLAFAAGSIAAILSWKALSSPLRYIALALGTVALVSLIGGLFFIGWAPVARLGDGGIERWIAYPVVLWMVSFGAYLVSRPAAIRAKGAAPQQETEYVALQAGVSRMRYRAVKNSNRPPMRTENVDRCGSGCRPSGAANTAGASGSSSPPPVVSRIGGG
jgi:hypothetical membrane protein